MKHIISIYKPADTWLIQYHEDGGKKIRMTLEGYNRMFNMSLKAPRGRPSRSPVWVQRISVGSFPAFETIDIPKLRKPKVETNYSWALIILGFITLLLVSYGEGLSRAVGY